MSAEKTKPRFPVFMLKPSKRELEVNSFATLRQALGDKQTVMLSLVEA
ncbi:MAG: hypothetical protein ACE5ER_04535 [Nitrospinaceae bacterium]